MAVQETRNAGVQMEIGNSDPGGPVPPLLLGASSVVSTPPCPHTIGRGYQRRLLEDLLASTLGAGRPSEPWSEDLEQAHFVSSSESSEED